MVSAALCLGLDAAYWKPVQSGVEPETDTECVRRLTGLSTEHFFGETYKLSEPMSPHASAAIDGVTIDLDRFQLPSVSQSHLIVEGAGGLLVPLNDKHLMIDLIEQLALPVVVVARSGLGTLNHTLLTVGQLRERGLHVVGVVMNGEPHASNRAAIEHYGQVRVIAEIPPLGELTKASINTAFSYFEANRENSGEQLSNLASLHPDENRRTPAAGQAR